MLRSIEELKNYTLLTRDGHTIGRCRDFLFDDEEWRIRYMVADTGRWLPGRNVLIPPHSIRTADWASHRLEVDMTRRQIEKSPPLSAHEPVSRQMEKDIHRFFGWNPYWTSPGLNRPTAFPPALLAKEEIEGRRKRVAAAGDHLRSVEEVVGYHIHARDGEIGHVEDFIADDKNWMLRYVVIDTRNVLPGRKVLVAPEWVETIDWAGQGIQVDLKKSRIEHGPVYDPSAPVNRRYETRLYDYYGRPAYWI